MIINIMHVVVVLRLSCRSHVNFVMMMIVDFSGDKAGSTYIKLANCNVKVELT